MQVTLNETGTYMNSWIVIQGIGPGAQLILDGLDNLGADAEITTVPVTIDAEGVTEIDSLLQECGPEAAVFDGNHPQDLRSPQSPLRVVSPF